MQNLRNKLIAGGAVLILALIGSVMNKQAAQAQGPGGPTVTIGSPLPLPVTGTVAVTGNVATTGTVAANQSGAWTVGINGTPTVNVGGPVTATQSGTWNVGITGNTEANPLWISDSDSPARHSFVLLQTSSTGGGILGTVPAGQRYVVEHYAIECGVDLLYNMTDMEIEAGLDHDHTVPHAVGQDGTINGHLVTSWVGSGNVRMYADPGQVIQFVGFTSTSFSSTSGIESCQATAAGYSVSLP